MDLAQHYNRLFQESVQKIKTDQYEPDPLIDAPSDSRYGVTLLLRPDGHVRKEMIAFLEELKAIEPNQYFYPETDLHVTVMSIISCYEGFDITKIAVKDYVGVIQKSLEGISAFDLEFRGLTASPSCLMVQGFPLDDTLEQMRNNLRKHFRPLALEQSLDKRYVLQTAHATILRVRDKLQNKAAFLDLIERNRNRFFGRFSVRTLAFVHNDWYQRKDKVKVLHRFGLEA
ncbi:2'-5' RNA ligase family protein [Thermophagus sp. OGC60D27]|uniref:2'-5' RNA ligase family protein n=1 Tax=Thermophagus sp. OGC60D27 TaxID=3458415 RepID=UPI004037C8E1